MPIRDEVASWFIRNIVMPGSQIFDKAGFVCMHLTGPNIFLREIVIPELFFVNLEKAFVEKLGALGPQLLYSAGKKFGYQYAKSGQFPTIDKVDKASFEKFCYLLVRYTEGTYAEKILHEIDYANKRMYFSFTNFVICPKNGLGHFLMEGGIAGIWSYLVNDLSVEAIKTSCQGRGANECKLIVAPESLLSGLGLTLHSERQLENLGLDQKYGSFNAIRQTQTSRSSFQKLLETKAFSYSGGFIERAKTRYFLCVSSAFFILELECAQSPEAKKILFDEAYNIGKVLAASGGNISFISEYLGATGWGDIALLKKQDGYKVFVNFFPFDHFYQKSDLTVFRGLVSGMISAISGEAHYFKSFKMNTSLGYLSVEIGE